MIKNILKSLFLFLLVISSLVLTVLVWRYERDFSEVETSLTALPNTGYGEQVEFSQIIRPYQYVLIDGNEVNGTQDISAMNTALNTELSSSEVESLQMDTDLSSVDHVISDIDAQHFLILDFMTDIPVKTFLAAYGIDYEGFDPRGNLNRAIIDLQDNEAELYLIDKSNQNTTFVNVEINSSAIIDILSSEQTSFERFSSIITNSSNASRLTSIYSPSAPASMNREMFISSMMSVEQLNQVMFLYNDYSSSNQNGITVYENDQVATYYNNETFRYLYQNKHEEESSSMNDHVTIRKNFDFLNSHRSMNSASIIFDYNSDNSELVLRESIDGKLVFSDEINNTTVVRDGIDEIYEFQRMQLRMSTQIPSQDSVELPNIETVRYDIANSDDLSLQFVTNFVLGYNMRFSEEQSELNLVTFTPSWFILYDGEWMRYEEGGLN
ncbi:YycH family regulatory protein [Aliicoccus persicus]|uniref:Two-component signal transduction system YycFG, regulatory protein YycH n=1 Tax=Aliicoccus persicus TaxID=930138 RepID=A0A662Z4J0_9STAP|nr:two-component system activity regulator YycH [Aliicoccus persicus]SEV92992.1 Two-component signal transduction system YycFG, regulatory protein YycH [Aliicoccus persicus]